MSTEIKQIGYSCVGCGSRKWKLIDFIAYFWVMVDPWTHDTANPFYSDVGDYICPIAAVFTGGECSAAESVISVSTSRTKAENSAF
jgi:hypothetical protein